MEIVPCSLKNTFLGHMLFIFGNYVFGGQPWSIKYSIDSKCVSCFNMVFLLCWWQQFLDKQTYKQKHVFEVNTRLSYYNVTTRLVDLVGLCWFKNKYEILLDAYCNTWEKLVCNKRQETHLSFEHTGNALTRTTKWALTF